MRQICILHEQAEWDRGLIAELERHGFQCTAWPLCDLHVAMLRPPPQYVLYLNRYSPSSFWRGHSSAHGSAHSVITWLEANGCIVINGKQALELEVSKVAQALACKRVGLRCPYTELAVGKPALLRAAQAWGQSISRHSTPVMVKPNCGGSGNGVRHYPTSQALVAALEEDDEVDSAPDGVMLLQQFIESAFVHRLEFVGSKLLYAIRIRTDTASFNHCPCDQDVTQACALGQPAFEITPEFPATDGEFMLVQALERMLRSYRVDVAGIEVIQDARNRWWVIDCNCCNTNYNAAAEARANIPLGGNAAIAQWLLGAASSREPSTAAAPPPDPHSDMPSGAGASDEHTPTQSCTPSSS